MGEKKHLAYAPVMMMDSEDVEHDSRNGPPRENFRLKLFQSLGMFTLGLVVASRFFLFLQPQHDIEAAVLQTTETKVEVVHSPAPPLPLTTVVFEENITFTARPSIETDRAWNNLLPVWPAP